MRLIDERSVEILDDLKDLYPTYLRPEISSVRILVKGSRCYLEIGENTSIVRDDPHALIDEKIYRKDLGFISDDLPKIGQDGAILYPPASFDPSLPLEVLAHRFVEEMTPVCIINTSNLFTLEAARKISESQPRLECPPNGIPLNEDGTVFVVQVEILPDETQTSIDKSGIERE